MPGIASKWEHETKCNFHFLFTARVSVILLWVKYRCMHCSKSVLQVGIRVNLWLKLTWIITPGWRFIYNPNGMIRYPPFCLPQVAGQTPTCYFNTVRFVLSWIMTRTHLLSRYLTGFPFNTNYHFYLFISHKQKWKFGCTKRDKTNFTWIQWTIPETSALFKQFRTELTWNT